MYIVLAVVVAFESIVCLWLGRRREPPRYMVGAGLIAFLLVFDFTIPVQSPPPSIREFLIWLVGTACLTFGAGFVSYFIGRAVFPQTVKPS